MASQDFDPMHYPQDGMRALTLAIRSLRTGERVSFPDGTVVRSVVVPHGRTNQRRFAVIPPGGSGRAAEKEAAQTATLAAARALTFFAGSGSPS